MEAIKTNKKCFAVTGMPILSKMIFGIIVFSGLLTGTMSRLHARLLDTRLNITFKAATLDICMEQLQVVSGLPFAYEIKPLTSFLIKERTFKEASLSIILDYLLAGTGYGYEEQYQVILLHPEDRSTQPDALTYSFCGSVRDGETGVRLAGVIVLVAGKPHLGTVSDENGFFRFSADTTVLDIQFLYLGYRKRYARLQEQNRKGCDTVLLDVLRQDLDSLHVHNMSSVSGISLLNTSPSFLPRFNGDLDLFSVLKTYAGIQGANDGTGALNVRGGSPDQNLVMLDGATLYNSSPLLGLMAVANAPALKTADVYKGAFPASFNGRLSSIWDLQFKSGSDSGLHGDLSLGTLEANLMLEGPLLKNKTTFMLSARRSYHEIYLRIFKPGTVLYFHDFAFKIHHRLSAKDHLYFSGYYSNDVISLENTTGGDSSRQKMDKLSRNTDNYVGVFRWRHDFSDHYLLNTELSYSAFTFRRLNQIILSDDYVRNELNEIFRTGLKDFSLKSSLEYTVFSQHKIKAGFYATRYQFDPSIFIQQESLFFGSDSLPSRKAEISTIEAFGYTGGVYIEDNWGLSTAWNLAVGLNGNIFDRDRSWYVSLQPRIRIRFEPNRAWSLSFFYVRMNQNLHRITNNVLLLPVDIWMPSGNGIRPQVADQLGFNISYLLAKHDIRLSLEPYYKKLRHVSDFVFNEAFFLNPVVDLAANVVAGSGNAYGLDVLLEKQKGWLRGWISYTFSQSKRHFAEINSGNSFTYRYNQLHNLNLVFLCSLGKGVELSSVFTFQSRPHKPLPMVRDGDTSMLVMGYLDRESLVNNRLRPYHRLDLGVSWTKNYNAQTAGTWSFRLLNVYNRENAFPYWDNYDPTIRSVGTRLFPITVSLSFRFQF